MKCLLAFFMAILSATAVLGQNCKYKTNDIDKFTGKYTKVTKDEKVIGTFYTAGLFRIKKVDTSYAITFDYQLASYSNFDPYSIDKGAQLIFLLENGSQVTLQSADKIAGIKKTYFGLPPTYACNLFNVDYPVTADQLNSFLKYKVKSIRFYRNESNGKETFVDNDIKSKNQDDIQKLVKCIL